MQNVATVVVERQDEKWQACFSSVPNFVRTADTPGDAMSTLLSLFREIEFSQGDVSLVQERSSEGHLEFTIPYRLLRPAEPSHQSALLEPLE
ncbi:hypothetical protein [Schlesneria paludicola]|uniref:hypothetical protein n=1 Tax=Schlesneria paludicola TaxID=360056 RepID=UPI00029AE085|nr:hypothetical protein [Schlesneria paludicola]